MPFNFENCIVVGLYRLDLLIILYSFDSVIGVNNSESPTFVDSFERQAFESKEFTRENDEQLPDNYDVVNVVNHFFDNFDQGDHPL